MRSFILWSPAILVPSHTGALHTGACTLVEQCPKGVPGPNERCRSWSDHKKKRGEAAHHKGAPFVFVHRCGLVPLARPGYSTEFAPYGLYPNIVDPQATLGVALCGLWKKRPPCLPGGPTLLVQRSCTPIVQAGPSPPSAGCSTKLRGRRRRLTSKTHRLLRAGPEGTKNYDPHTPTAHALRGFESEAGEARRNLPALGRERAGVTQLVEYPFCNRVVEGSNPFAGTGDVA